VWKQALKDVGMREGKSNTGAVQVYTKFWNQHNPRAVIVLNSPYCASACYYWFAKAGFEPHIKFAPRALDWKTYGKEVKIISLLTTKELEELPKSGVIVFRNSWGGNHTGLHEKYVDFNFFTIEANTSNARSLKKYNERFEGVFYLKTHINNTALRPMYYIDVLQQATEFKGK
jgi:hypothetical protein